MKFAYAIVYVKDVPQTVEFYEKVFGLSRRFMDDSNQYAEMETGATALAFAANELGKINFPGGFQENTLNHPAAGIEIALVTEDVTGAYARAVSGGAVGLAAPELKPWGQLVAYVRDLNGVLVEICTAIT